MPFSKRHTALRSASASLANLDLFHPRAERGNQWASQETRGFDRGWAAYIVANRAENALKSTDDG